MRRTLMSVLIEDGIIGLLRKKAEPNTVVVSKHPALIDYLAEIGLIKERVRFLKNATPKDINGKKVIGTLPNSLACYAESFTEVPLKVPVEMRHEELTVEHIRQYAGKSRTYAIRSV